MIDASLKGFACHWRWFLVNRANALAPIPWAFNGAFSTPPDALTWAPTNFICIYLFHKKSIFYMKQPVTTNRTESIMLKQPPSKDVRVLPSFCIVMVGQGPTKIAWLPQSVLVLRINSL
jgi:hypothetical protein